MTAIRPNLFSVLAAFVLLASVALWGQATESAITDQLKNLRAVPEAQRPAATLKLAQDIHTLQGGLPKLRLADELEHLSTEGDAGAATMQAVADTLTEALTQSPVPAKGNVPAMPYTDLAKLVRYENVTTTLEDPQYVKAKELLVTNEADIAKSDFTLKDLHGKRYTLSELRGKIVLVNFWATWCAPCRVEMPILDGLSQYFESQGLVVLSITDEDPFKVSSFVGGSKYHPPILIDTDAKVHKEFHIGGIPNTYLFDRDGKLLAVAIDQRTQRQFLQMLSKTDLHVNR